MTVRGFLRFVARMKGVRRAEVDGEVVRVMERVHVGDVSDRIVGRLSKGYRQRVGLAQALLADPPVLVLDEPTVGLDPRQIHEVRELIREWSGRHTVILSTHILPEVEQTCSRVVIISRGRIVAVDTPKNLIGQLRGGDRTRLDVRGPLGEILPRLRGLAGVTGVRELEPAEGHVRIEVESGRGADLRPVLARTVVEGGWDLLEMQAATMSLEDIFIELTTQDEGAASPAPA
jgi:ABC-2 type transport system ATP-binding protein